MFWKSVEDRSVAKCGKPRVKERPQPAEEFLGSLGLSSRSHSKCDSQLEIVFDYVAL